MRRALAGLLFLAPVLAVPFALSPDEPLFPGPRDPLVNPGALSALRETRLFLDARARVATDSANLDASAELLAPGGAAGIGASLRRGQASLGFLHLAYAEKGFGLAVYGRPKGRWALGLGLAGKASSWAWASGRGSRWGLEAAHRRPLGAGWLLLSARFRTPSALAVAGAYGEERRREEERLRLWGGVRLGWRPGAGRLGAFAGASWQSPVLASPFRVRVFARTALGLTLADGVGIDLVPLRLALDWRYRWPGGELGLSGPDLALTWSRGRLRGTFGVAARLYLRFSDRARR